MLISIILAALAAISHIFIYFTSDIIIALQSGKESCLTQGEVVDTVNRLLLGKW